MAQEGQPFSILVAVQDDETADQAVAEAFRVADAHGAVDLHAVHVLRSKGAVKKLDERLEKAPATLQKIIARAAPRNARAHVIGHVRGSDNPAHAILQLATDIAADMIVLGTHRRRGLEKLMLGSVADKVLQDAHCPVLVVVPKDYQGQDVSPRIEPPCPKCLQIRRETRNETFWCEQHQREYHQPHLYVPSDAARSSVMPRG